MLTRLGMLTVVTAAAVVIVTVTPAGQQPRPVDVPAGLLLRAQSDGAVRVLVRVDAVAQPEGALGPAGVANQRTAIAAGQRRAMQAVENAGASEMRPFAAIPFVSMRVSPVALRALAATAGVVSIEEDRPVPLNLAQSRSITGAALAAAQGYTGNGWSVAIIDSGVAKAHPFFGGRVVSEACYSLNATCPGGTTQSTVTGSGEPGTGGNFSSHGTHVAGIAAGKGATFAGVAPMAGIVAIQVFSQITGCGVCTYTSDYIRGLERVLAIHATFKIAAVNMSLGGGQFTSQATCDASNAATKAAIDNLRSVGVATVIASGNDSYTNALSSPGCISTAVSVGSTTKSDAVSGFSNSASFLHLLAPGGSITSSIPGGGFGVSSGTSMAAPHVAGAWAVLRQAAPTATVTQVLSALQTTGTPLTDVKSPTITRPRINIASAIQALAPPFRCQFTLGASSVTVGAAGGTGTVALTSNSGGCGWTAGGGADGIVISPGYTSGTGSATVQYQYPANPLTFTRTAVLEIAGQSLTVTQTGLPATGCCDTNADGHPDLFWRNQVDGQLAVWQLSRTRLTESLPLGTGRVADLNWRIEAVADMDNDGDGDLIWRHITSGDLAIWVLNGHRLVDSLPLVPGRVGDLQWRIAGSGDFNGDGKQDLFWQNGTTGDLAVWYMDGRRLIDSVSLSHRVTDPTWRVSAVDDMDRDGDADLIWQRTSTGDLAIWVLDGRRLEDSLPLSPGRVADTNWSIVGTADFNGDRRPDLIWQHATTGDIAGWYMNGRVLIDSVPLGSGRVANLDWKIVGPR